MTSTLVIAALALGTVPAAPAAVLLKPDRVFDGKAAHDGWVVLVRGDRIAAVGPAAKVAAGGARVIDLPGTTLLPGLIDAHTHLLLHPYNEASWDDQVLQGVARAAHCARHEPRRARRCWPASPRIRDLGTEGAGYADVGIKQAIDQGIIPGPRMLVVDPGHRRHRQLRPARASAPRWRVPQGAEEADGVDDLVARRPRPDRAAAPTGSRSTPTSRWGPGGETPADVLARGDGAVVDGGPQRGRAGRRPRHVGRRGCGGRRWPASRRSSTATTATRRCSA